MSQVEFRLPTHNRRSSRLPGLAGYASTLSFSLIRRPGGAGGNPSFAWSASRRRRGGDTRANMKAQWDQMRRTMVKDHDPTTTGNLGNVGKKVFV
jgi:hypothetical protein